MLEVTLVLGLIAFISSAIAYPIVMIELDLSINPFRIRRGIRAKREHNRIRRISELEHDLGYLPCNDNNCYSCTMKIKYDVPEQPRLRWVPPRG